MMRLLVFCIYLIVLDLLGTAVAAPPTWTTTSAITIASTELATECDSVTFLRANSGDATAVSFSLQSQVPDGGFTIVNNPDAGEDELRCTSASITESSYTVIIRASQLAGDTTFTDQTFTITVTGLVVACGDPDPVTGATFTTTDGNNDNSAVTYVCSEAYDHTAGDLTRACTGGSWSGTLPTCSPKPVWTTAVSFELEKSNSNACTELPELTATTVSSSVSYSLVSQNPDEAGFTIVDNGGNFLTCNQADLTVTTYTVVVRATDDGTGASADLSIAISVKVPPVFVEPSPDPSEEAHKIYLCETLQAGAEIMTLVASDEDGDTGWTFSMSESEPATTALFEIDGDKLKVKADVAVDTFDIDKTDAVLEYPIILTVSDASRNTTLTTKIYVEDDNDNAPVFEGSFSATILETVTAGTYVLNVSAVDSDKTTENNNVSYTLTGADEFELNGEIIQVAAGASLDVTTTNTYSFIVTASDNVQDAPQSTDQTITITIQSEPQFGKLNSAKTASVLEDATESTGLYELAVTDRDNTGALTITVVSSQETFIVDGQTIKLKSGQSLDAETKQTYAVQVTASDGTYEVTSEILTITVTDVNDNPPIFTELSPEVYISEEVAIGTSVYKSEAQDADISNPTLKYSVTELGNQHFAIDENTGDITTTVALDYTTNNLFNLQVTVKDGETPGDKSANTIVTVRLKTAPRFIDPIDGAELNISENTAIRNSIKTIFSSDPDGDSPTYTLLTQVPDTPQKLFELQGDKISTSSTFDIDADDAVRQYTLQLKVSDGLSYTDDEIITLIINIEDSNDNTPTFAHGTYTQDVLETAAEGDSVITVVALDEDYAEPNNLITYTVSGTADFSINPETGEITVAAELEYDRQQQYDIKVTATDKGSPPKSSTADITFTIYSEPEFSNLATETSIQKDENLAADTVVFELIVTDADDTWDKVISISSQTPGDMFKVEGNAVKTKTGGLDAESEQLYSLKFKVIDGSFEVESEVLTININDMNDNQPVITQVDPVTIDENESIGTTLFDVTATDGDVTEANNVVSYSIISGNDDNNFKIDTASGEVTLEKAPQLAQYSLKIKVSDSGTPVQTATTDVTISVKHMPKFINLATATLIQKDENLAADTVVFVLTVTDVDDTWDKVISISSQTPGDMFKVEGNAVKTKTGGLDAESEQSYSLKFKVIDGSFEVESEVLMIQINDMNDNPPVITQVDPVAIDENEPIGTTLFDVTATDGDVTEANNVVSYSIISGNDENNFRIETTSGEVTLEKAPQSAQYSLKIKVSDSGSPVQTATTDVTISVNQNAVDECSSNRCQNGGTCTSTVNAFLCSCVPGWIGTNCEIDKNECSPNPCQNRGTCTDGINSFTCNCTEGWGGDACTAGCTSNTYGRNCEDTCNCNASRLVTNDITQQCDIQTGGCRCNDYWIGSACETDVDECNDTSTCSSVSNLVCENTIGSFYCTCEQGFVNNSGNCVRDTRPNDITPASGEVRVTVRMSLNVPCPDLKKPSEYNKIKADIEKTLNNRLSFKKRFVVYNITCGSINYNTQIIADRQDVPQLSSEISNLKKTFTIDGNTVDVNDIKVNERPLNTSTASQTSESICQVYTSIEACGKDEECRYENGTPSCKLIEPDSIALILGLGLGICLPLLLMAITAAACFYWYRMKKIRHDKRYRQKELRKENSPWYGHMKSNGTKMDTRNYYGNNHYDNGNFNSYSIQGRFPDVPAIGYTSI